MILNGHGSVFPEAVLQCTLVQHSHQRLLHLIQWSSAVDLAFTHNVITLLITPSYHGLIQHLLQRRYWMSWKIMQIVTKPSLKQTKLDSYGWLWIDVLDSSAPHSHHKKTFHEGISLSTHCTPRDSDWLSQLRTLEMAQNLAWTVHVVISWIFSSISLHRNQVNKPKKALLYCIDRFTSRTSVNVKSRILSGYNYYRCVGGAVATVNIWGALVFSIKQ